MAGGGGAAAASGDSNGGAPPAPAPGSHFYQRYLKLNRLICELVDDYSLVSFSTLNIEDIDSVAKVGERTRVSQSESLTHSSHPLAHSRPLPQRTLTANARAATRAAL